LTRLYQYTHIKLHSKKNIMKDFLLKASRRLAVLFVSICLFSTHSAKAGGLSGTYTIGSSGTYASFSAAASALASNGVSGKVIFNVAAGTYSEQVSIGNITGASATNTITFKGQSDSSKVVLTSASSSSSTTNYTLELNNSRYVTIDHITITRTGTATYGTAVALDGNTKYCNFTSDLVSGTVNPNTSGSVTGNIGAINSSGADSFDVFNGNRIKNGGNGIDMAGTSYGYSNSITNNIFDTSGQAGIYVTNGEIDILIKGNTFNMGAFPSSVSHQISYGIRIVSAQGYQILKNKIYSSATAATVRSINPYSCTADGNGNRNLIADNYIWISGGTSASTALALYGSSSTDVVYNNILVTSSLSKSACIFFNTSFTGSSVNIENNNLDIAGSSGYCIDAEAATTTTGISTCDYNNFYTNATYLTYYVSSQYSTLSSYQSGSGIDAHSLNVNPNYTSNTNLKSTNVLLAKAGIKFSAVTDDINGNSRNNPPCIGANEFVPVSGDAGISAITAPASGFCTGSYDVKVALNDFGTDTLRSCTIAWTVNGSAQTSYSSTSKISPSSSTTIDLGSFNFSAGTALIKAWTTKPNGGTDGNNSNDTSTLTVTVYALPAANAGKSANICPGSSDSIGAAAVAGSTYSWTSSPSGFTSTLSKVSVTPSSTTTSYTLTETSSHGCVNSNTITLTQTLPAAKTISSTTVCSGSPISIGAAAVTGSTYAWISSPSGFTSTSSNPSVSPTTTTSYTVTETSIYGCQASNSLTVTVVALPATPSAGSSANICAGNTIQIGGASSSGLTYAWTSSPSGFTSTASNAYVSPASTTTYSVTATSTTTSCVSLPASVTITVNPLPAAAAGSNAAVCSGNAATIGATAVAGDNYSWTSSPSGYSSTASTASVSPTASTVYYVTETNPATGCYKTNSVLITVNPLPAAYAGSSAALCSGAPTTTIGGTSVSGNTYSWSPTSYLSSGTVSNPTVTLGATTTYTLTEKITATGCTKSNSITLTLNQSPAANTGVSQAMCAGTFVNLGTTAVSGNTYSWSPATGLSSASASNPKATPATTTNYALTETVTATGCKTTNVVNVTVNQLPAAYIGATSATSICAGTSYSLGGTPVTGSLYSWTSSPSGFTSSIANPNASPTAATTYTLVETNAATGCSNSNSVSIGIITLPVANVTTTAICAGTNGVVVANYTTSTEVFKWYYNGSLLKNQTGFRVITANGGAYQAYITDNNTGCSNMSNVANLVVNPLPSANVKALQATTQCQGDSVVLVAPLDSYDVYQWSSNGNPISGANAYLYSAKQSGSYQVSVTSSVTTCSNTSPAIAVTVNPVPNVPFNVPGKTTICDGQNVLMNTSQQTGVTYTWYKNNNAISGTDSNYYSAKTTGAYSVQVMFDSTGCSAMSTPVSVTVNALPQTNVAALGNTNLCPGASVLLVADPAAGNTYRWENGTSYIAGASSDTFSVNQAGSYAVTVTNTLGCAATSTPLTVTAALHPTVTINRPSNTTFCQNTITLTVQDTEAASFQWWKDGSAIPGATGDSLVVDQTGFYAVMVQGTITCSAMDTIGITDNPVPNAVFSVSRDTVCFGNGINFYNQSTLSAGNMIYTWTTGDGDTSFNTNISHNYAKPGLYNVKLNVAAASGCNATAAQTVRVLPITKSTFNVIPEGYRRLGFKATDTTGSTYVWNYGDSTFGTGYNGYHQYSKDGKYNITLTAINANGCVTSTTNSEVIILSGFGQVSSENLNISIFPNPFTTQTNVQYNLNESSMVQIDVYDINGRTVAHVDNSMQAAGNHNYIFNGSNPGIYFVKMIVGGQQFVNRIVQQ